MEDMNTALEDLVMCASLGRGDRDCVERALDEGYAALNAADRARIRRLLNQRSARSASGSALQRYRQRRVTAAITSRVVSRPARGKSAAQQTLH